MVGPPSRPGPEDDRTSLVDRSEPSVNDRWKKALGVLRERGAVRWGLLGVLAVLQVFVLFSAVMWWLGSSTASATANVAPQTWTGIVYDVGAAGVNLRSDPQVRPDDARDTAARGSRLALSCGETGDVVAKGPVKTATWVKTTDGLFVSMLYVHVAGHTSIPSCNGSKVDGPLVALADPANPQLPPPPGTQLGAGELARRSDSPRQVRPPNSRAAARQRQGLRRGHPPAAGAVARLRRGSTAPALSLRVQLRATATGGHGGIEQPHDRPPRTRYGNWPASSTANDPPAAGKSAESPLLCGRQARDPHATRTSHTRRLKYCAPTASP